MHYHHHGQCTHEILVLNFKVNLILEQNNKCCRYAFNIQNSKTFKLNKLSMLTNWLWNEWRLCNKFCMPIFKNLLPCMYNIEGKKSVKCDVNVCARNCIIKQLSGLITDVVLMWGRLTCFEDLASFIIS